MGMHFHYGGDRPDPPYLEVYEDIHKVLGSHNSLKSNLGESKLMNTLPSEVDEFIDC